MTDQDTKSGRSKFAEPENGKERDMKTKLVQGLYIYYNTSPWNHQIMIWNNFFNFRKSAKKQCNSDWYETLKVGNEKCLKWIKGFENITGCARKKRIFSHKSWLNRA